jgi:hypothetical protein
VSGTNQKGRKEIVRSRMNELIASAWLNVRKDLVGGINQTCGYFWKRIEWYYNGNKTFVLHCNESSLMHRWLTILEDVNKFYGCRTRLCLGIKVDVLFRIRSL